MLDELKRQVDTILALTPSLDEAGPFHKHCHWILERPPGEFPTKLRIDLEAYCREKAVPALYLRLVTERAHKLDVRLATLRRLEVGYPGHLVGSPGFVGRADVPGAYARALEDRLTAAQPQVIADLAESFRTKTLGAVPRPPSPLRGSSESWARGVSS